MWRNYLNISWRTLLKNRVYSVINIGGLALGLAVSTLILLYVLHEFSFDQFHDKTDRIVRMKGSFKFGDQSFNTLAMSAGFGPIVQENIPEVANFVRMTLGNEATLKRDKDRIFKEDQFLLVDPAFFDVFSFPLRQGDPKTVISKPQTMVITPAMAKKYFGEEDPIGKTILHNGTLPFEVTGIIEPAPSNSTIQFDFVGALSSLTAIERADNPDATSEQLTLESTSRISLGNLVTYLETGEEVNPDSLAKKIYNLALSRQETESTGNIDNFMANTIKDIHLKSNFGSIDAFNVDNVYLFLGIAFLILSLALVNYISLSTARLVQRAKEVGVRKVIGAKRRDLIIQFFSESAMLTLGAFAIALIILNFTQPLFHNLLGIQIDQSFLFNPFIIGTLAGLLVVCIIISGVIPAYGFSAFSTLSVLKGGLSSGKQGNRLRQALIIFQFVATIGLIMGTIIVSQQLKYLQKQSASLMDAPIVVVPFSAEAGGMYQAYRDKLNANVELNKIATSSDQLFQSGISIYFIQSEITDKDVPLSFMNVDDGFLDMFQLDWVKPPVDVNRIGAPKTIILNEMASIELGMVKDSLSNDKTNFNGEALDVVGVLEDFHYQSLRNTIRPLAMFVKPEGDPKIAANGGAFYIELEQETDVTAQLAMLKSIHQEFDAENPFDYYFLDDTFANFYLNERRLSTMLTSFTLLAIIISCLGLFGLITYNTERRTKEIGIRKVLGASIASIIKLLSKDFVILVIISLIIAAPITYKFMGDWLENFPYRIDMPWWVFIVGGLGAILLAFVIVSTQSLRAALANPVKALRNE